MGSQFDPSAWSTFFSAQIGASAGLTGLIFVAVSINLKQIVELPHLVARSAKALFTLVGVLLTSPSVSCRASRSAPWPENFSPWASFFG